MMNMLIHLHAPTAETPSRLQSRIFSTCMRVCLARTDAWHLELLYSPLCTFSVRSGVDHFKHGRHVDAMNEYNKALDIDKNNVEALVARGAL